MEKDSQLKVEGKVNLFIFEKDVVDVLIILPQELQQLVIAWVGNIQFKCNRRASI